MTNHQQSIYNSWLYANRKATKAPFGPRKRFDNIDEDLVLYIEKLERMFNSYNNISMEDFFKAPYVLNPDNKYNDLKFYTTYVAKKNYKDYMNRKEVSSPDDKDVMESCKDAVKYIFRYCKANKLTLEQYKNAHPGAYPTPLMDLKSHKINMYVLHALEIDPIIKGVDSDLLNFAFNDFYQLYRSTHNKFLGSKKLKQYVRDCIKVVETQLQN